MTAFNVRFESLNFEPSEFPKVCCTFIQCFHSLASHTPIRTFRMSGRWAALAASSRSSKSWQRVSGFHLKSCGCLFMTIDRGWNVQNFRPSKKMCRIPKKMGRKRHKMCSGCSMEDMAPQTLEEATQRCTPSHRFTNNHDKRHLMQFKVSRIHVSHQIWDPFVKFQRMTSWNVYIYI